jgi:Fuc2NAc and GlcNAc transferase
VNYLLLCVMGLATFAIAALTTGYLRGYAVRNQLIDHPNFRSTHQLPTPRGGGMAIVIGFSLALIAATAIGAITVPHAIGIGCAGGLVALVGFWDDHGHVAARWRLLAHFTAASWLLAWLGPLPHIPLLAMWGAPAPLAYLLAAIFIVWMVNLFNFMDGIDGIASVQALTTSLGFALICLLTGFPELMPLHLLLSAAVLGFLVWNWPPARIFMGDVGSGFLGILLAALAFWSGIAEPALFTSWLILSGVFIIDSSFTLLRRILRGDRVYEAHRTHAYQHAARRLGAHGPVTIAVGVINLLWLLPWAIAAGIGRMDGSLSLFVAYAPLVALAWWWGAGVPDEGSRGHPFPRWFA